MTEDKTQQLRSAALQSRLDEISALLAEGVDARFGVEQATSIAGYELLAPTPRSPRVAQATLHHLAGWASYCEHPIADLVAALVEDGAIVNRAVIMQALARPSRAEPFFRAAAEAGARLDVLWSILPRGGGDVPVAKTLRDMRITELADVVKSQDIPTAKAREKQLVTELGAAPKEPIPPGDPRWRAAQLLAYCADGDTRSIPKRRVFEKSQLPSWVPGAVEESLPLLPAELAEPLKQMAPTEPTVLAALVGGREGVTPGGEGLLAAVCRESLLGSYVPVLKALLEAGVSADIGGVSPLFEYLSRWQTPYDEAEVRALIGRGPLTAAERSRLESAQMSHLIGSDGRPVAA